MSGIDRRDVFRHMLGAGALAAGTAGLVALKAALGQDATAAPAPAPTDDPVLNALRARLARSTPSPHDAR